MMTWKCDKCGANRCVAGRICSDCLSPMQRWAETNIGDLPSHGLQQLYYGDTKPMPSEKTTPVPDELLRELNRLATEVKARPRGERAEQRYLYELCNLVSDKLPAPPPLDPVEECAKHACDQANGNGHWEREPHTTTGWLRSARNIIRRYRELGCPELK